MSHGSVLEPTEILDNTEEMVGATKKQGIFCQLFVDDMQLIGSCSSNDTSSVCRR